MTSADDRTYCKLMFKRSNQQVLKLKKRHCRNDKLIFAKNQLDIQQSGESKRFLIKPGVLQLPSLTHSRNITDFNGSSRYMIN